MTCIGVPLTAVNREPTIRMAAKGSQIKKRPSQDRIILGKRYSGQVIIVRASLAKQTIHSPWLAEPSQSWPQRTRMRINLHGSTNRQNELTASIANEAQRPARGVAYATTAPAIGDSMMKTKVGRKSQVPLQHANALPDPLAVGACLSRSCLAKLFHFVGSSPPHGNRSKGCLISFAPPQSIS
jgi:hypothetical protein